MDQVKVIFRSFPPAPSITKSTKQYDSAIKQHLSALSKLSHEERVTIFSKPAAILKVLNPAVNSIGYLTILDMVLDGKAEAAKHGEILDKTIEFLIKFDVCQVRYVMMGFFSLLQKVGAGHLFSPLVATELLATAILRLDPSGSMFTPAHLVLARLAYTTNSVEPALKALDADILVYPNMSGSKEARFLCDPDIPPSAFMPPSPGLPDQPKSAPILEYNLLRGLIYISRRDWPKARAALEQVITHPSKERGVSRMMTDAHKKWVLVGLMHQGKAPSLPPYTNPAAQSGYQALSVPYTAIANLFSTDKTVELKAEVEANRQAWEDDGNASLVAEVMAAYQKWQIINLRRIYQRVSIAEVRRTTLSAETGEPLADDQTTVALVREMIESGMLNGEIQAGQGGGESYLAFGDNQSLMSEVEFAAEVARSHHSIQALSQQYRLANERLSGSKDYARYICREQRRAEMEREADAAVGFEAQIEDEDLMTGVLAHT
ncbi:COP9 signalosome complex subunit 3 [Tolypocladium ophioglossoides CBS 100239]|uniref:COP9 signalosome complex subunit 3 n=1 Tax=Tolypocladium ophioglossoides (strain CBS 100239) TaxID=1163406 RepID=A0A0L0N6P3_TOLOC|nr:COP9 signalosome complex subunit 3 [Tolypocladium ophioglossoides CBS 100239]